MWGPKHRLEGFAGGVPRFPARKRRETEIHVSGCSENQDLKTSTSQSIPRKPLQSTVLAEQGDSKEVGQFQSVWFVDCPGFNRCFFPVEPSYC